MILDGKVQAPGAIQVGSYVLVRSRDLAGYVLEVKAGFARVQVPRGDVWCDVADLELHAGSPAQAFSRGFVADDLKRFLLRERAIHLRWAYQYDPVFGLSNARIELKPHQVFTAMRVLRKSKPRMILADEVGLGKTIEAGLILRELRARGLLERLLIIVPASLVTQWQRELKSKFNEECHIYDGAFIRHLKQQDETGNPWTKYESIITSLPLARRPEHSEKIAEARWDVVLVDEAHHVRLKREGQEEVAVKAYRLVESLAYRAYGLLLLTATPMQLDPYEFYGLVQLVAPGLFADYQAFERQRRHVADLNRALRALEAFPMEMSGIDCAETTASLLELRTEDVREMLKSRVDRERLIDRVSDRHLLAQVMVRNRKRVLHEESRRRAEILYVDMTPEERAFYEDVSDYIRNAYGRAQGEKNTLLGFVMTTYRKILASSSYALGEALGRRAARLREEWAAGDGGRAANEADLTPEDLEEFGAEEAELELSDEIQLLEAVALEKEPKAEVNLSAREEIDVLSKLQKRAQGLSDSKLAVLLRATDQIIDADPTEKILIFTQFIETQKYLAQQLSKHHKVVVFNGRMDPTEKDRAWREFKERANVMVSTEAGGEGRNFQFAHVLINYDLPWNPMKVEQRIGRLDRIGQTHEVQVYNFSVRDTVEERVLELLQRRIGLFEETIGGLDPILGSVERDIRDIVFSPSHEYQKLFDDLDEALTLRLDKARRMERDMADLIMDRRSFRSDDTNRLLGREPAADYRDLERFVIDGLADYPSIDSRPRVLRARDGVLDISVPRVLWRSGLSERYAGTFSPKLALEEEGIDFFAFGHPLVDVLVRKATERDYVQPAACLRLDVPGAGRFAGFRFLFEIAVRKASGQDASRQAAESRKLLEVWLSEDGELRSDLDGLLWRSQTEPEPLDVAEEQRVVLERLEDLAVEHAMEACTREKKRHYEEWETLHDEELLRMQRLRDWRIAKHEDERDRIAENVARLRQSHRPEDLRILPAWEGQLKKVLEKIENLQADYEESVRTLGTRGEVSLSFEPLSVAYIEIPGVVA